VTDHIRNRRLIIDDLRRELVGPAPIGEDTDCSGDVAFSTKEEANRPRRQRGSGEEIVQRDRPTKRYGVGVLYPPEVPSEDDVSPQGADNPDYDVATPTEAVSARRRTRRQTAQPGGTTTEEVLPPPDADDFDISTANSYRPSSIAVSFRGRFPEGSVLRVDVSGGRYLKKVIRCAGDNRTWWLRKPVAITAEFAKQEVAAPSTENLAPTRQESTGADGLRLDIRVITRPLTPADEHLITACVVNRTANAGSVDEMALFQVGLRATVSAPSGEACILPYIDAQHVLEDEEEAAARLLYRKVKTFAVGHGCAAEWGAPTDTGLAHWVAAEPLPVCEVPSVTPDILDAGGQSLAVPMAVLAGLDPRCDGMAQLEAIALAYERWIEQRSLELSGVGPDLRTVARAHISECANCASKIRRGIEFLRSNAAARRAFQFANHAILLQQARGAALRTTSLDTARGRLAFSGTYKPDEDLTLPASRGYWRPFQIAFILMNLEAVAANGGSERERVELIWFPTGGGKTEAYLGLAAYCMFLRRLRKQDDTGVSVLMRYTLRLLTAQQFQRAARLICAMEFLRRTRVGDLGEGEFAIGIWLGGDSTPNTRADAVHAWREMNRKGPRARNMFVLDRCPWCGAQMGATLRQGRAGRYTVTGYAPRGDTVALSCPDRECAFVDALPVYVVDEDIYSAKPALVIGTIDKFAMLAWRPDARALFGIDNNGDRSSTPPELIIQDELHLISGPLGSVAGMYEAVIEELCTDFRTEPSKKPKIVCSTATIRRYREQVRALYARESVALFPPPGLDAEDSFFARYARGSDGRLLPGRIHVGVHAPGLGSLQTAQVRTMSALYQASFDLPTDARDPWWTLLLFFNSLRELGTTRSLFQSDIPDYLRALAYRRGLAGARMRPLDVFSMELTGRLGGDEVPSAIRDLEVRHGGAHGDAVDVCFATSIIEVGIDVDRLSLLCIVGQPKTTSQYIQVSGRVGRSWWERPGLVVTIYSASKPRDRSHFEKFRSYHERLYAQVEPTSVTPFSPPATERVMHALIAVYARQAFDQGLARRPAPYRPDVLDLLSGILARRIAIVAPDEATNSESVLRRRAGEWDRWQRMVWQGAVNNQNPPQMTPAGSYVCGGWADRLWHTPMSMRNVDASCEIDITQLYNL